MNIKELPSSIFRQNTLDQNNKLFKRKKKKGA
jgi:hypothetical protein